MLPLKNQRYLCPVKSGVLEMIDMNTKTSLLYAKGFCGKYLQCIVPFPGFDEEIFPLTLLKEW